MCIPEKRLLTERNNTSFFFSHHLICLQLLLLFSVSADEDLFSAPPPNKDGHLCLMTGSPVVGVSVSPVLVPLVHQKRPSIGLRG